MKASQLNKMMRLLSIDLYPDEVSTTHVEYISLLYFPILFTYIQTVVIMTHKWCSLFTYYLHIEHNYTDR